MNNQAPGLVIACSTIIVQPILVENLGRGDSRWALGLSPLFFLSGWVFTFVLEFYYYDRMSQKWGILSCVVRELEIATPSLAMTKKKGAMRRLMSLRGTKCRSNLTL